MTATAIETLNGRNRDFASHRHVSSLKMMPSMKTLIIGCVDPRVDPVDVLGVEAGEVAIIRNVGGRVTPSTIDTLAMLRQVTRAAIWPPAGTSWSCTTPIAGSRDSAALRSSSQASSGSRRIGCTSE